MQFPNQQGMPFRPDLERLSEQVSQMADRAAHEQCELGISGVFRVFNWLNGALQSSRVLPSSFESLGERCFG